MPPDYFDRNIIFHTHIAKAAGSSLTAGLCGLFGDDAVYKVSTPGAPRPDELPWDRKRSTKVLTGHFWYGQHETPFERRPIYIATVREPVDRFISLYGHVVSRTAHPLKPRFDAYGIDQSALWYFNDPVLRSEIANSLAGVSANAEYDLERDYAIVVPHKKTGELLAPLFTLFGQGDPIAPYVNVGSKRWALSAEVEAICRRNSWKDQQLCQLVEENYPRWLATLGQRMGL